MYDELVKRLRHDSESRALMVDAADAIEELSRSKYEDNKGKRWVRNPVAYTLYEVWRIVDSKVVYHPSAPKEEAPTGPYDLLYEEGGANTT